MATPKPALLAISFTLLVAFASAAAPAATPAKGAPATPTPAPAKSTPAPSTPSPSTPAPVVIPPGKAAINSPTLNEKPDQSSKKDDGLMTQVPADIAKQAATGNAAGVTYVDTAQDSMFMADVKKAGWNAQKCPPGLNKERASACTPKNCSRGGIPAKWKTSYLQKSKLGYELYQPGNPLTITKANPASCCNTCAGMPQCTYWQYIPDITIDGKKGKGACFLIHDKIDFTCGEMTAQYSTETKPVPLQVRIGGECNPHPKVLNDPHLVGAHGTHFDFNGRPDKAFCLLTDRNLHVNMRSAGTTTEDRERCARGRRKGGSHLD
ncbi:hypothetical protein CLOP_g1591 [Closterium sp. NIES-67]|nr:hypothetical protein CLOP_g1591 [Closterium sp. NIES-67]